MKVDFLALVGDIVSFPSEAGVEYVKRRLDESRSRRRPQRG